MSRPAATLRPGLERRPAAPRRPLPPEPVLPEPHAALVLACADRIRAWWAGPSTTDADEVMLIEQRGETVTICADDRATIACWLAGVAGPDAACAMLRYAPPGHARVAIGVDGRWAVATISLPERVEADA